MIFIIDANNLAGKLDILFEENFDAKLIQIIKTHFKFKGIKVYLIFDSIDLMGDQFWEDNIKVVYTPNGSYYNCADDKIVEVLEEKFKNSKDEITLVTDDLEIIEKVKEIEKKYKTNNIFYKKATVFAKEIENKAEKLENDEALTDRGLSGEQIDDINDELLSFWQ